MATTGSSLLREVMLCAIWVLYTYFKLYKWCQIAQSITSRPQILTFGKSRRQNWLWQGLTKSERQNYKKHLEIIYFSKAKEISGIFSVLKIVYLMALCLVLFTSVSATDAILLIMVRLIGTWKWGLDKTSVFSH